jgi:hypothetical protein
MKLSDRFRIPDEVIARQVGEETVILDLVKGAYFGLDPVGARMWQLLAEGRTLAEVCDVIENEYEVARAEIERDVVDLADKLAREGLVAPA